MWRFDVLVAPPVPLDVIELGPAEANKENRAFALDRANEEFREGVCAGRPVWDLDDRSGLGGPDGIKTGSELGIGIADQEIRRKPKRQGSAELSASQM